MLPFITQRCPVVIWTDMLPFFSQWTSKSTRCLTKMSACYWSAVLPFILPRCLQTATFQYATMPATSSDMLPFIFNVDWLLFSYHQDNKIPLIICSDMVSFVSPGCLLVTFSHFAEIHVVIRTDMLSFISLGWFFGIWSGMLSFISQRCLLVTSFQFIKTPVCCFFSIY